MNEEGVLVFQFGASRASRWGGHNLVAVADPGSIWHRVVSLMLGMAGSARGAFFWDRLVVLRAAEGLGGATVCCRSFFFLEVS